MKNKKSKFLAFLFLSLAWVSVLSAQSLRNLSYSQRPGTKLIDIRYDLVLVSGASAQIDFFFSFDNGQTYPIPCVSLTGDAGPFVVGGNDKKVVWDAGRDWNQNFTSQGRLKVRSTLAEKIEAKDFDLATVPFQSGGVEESPSWYIHDSYTNPVNPKVADARVNEVTLKVPREFSADKYEVTNYQWNKVVEWARTRGYDLQPVAFTTGEENLPRTNVSMAEVVKWLNARSEMDGLTPVFYADPMEPGMDFNGDGRLSTGTDSLYLTWEEEMDMWMPSFDWSLIANHGQSMGYQGWIEWDPNYNGRWDPGEPFVDRNRNGKFEPMEYEDFNGNGKKDQGQTIVCRTGDISSWNQNYLPANNGDLNMMFGWNLGIHVKESADGYRLPDALNWGYGSDLFRYLAMGGRTEQGSYQTWEDWSQPGFHDPGFLPGDPAFHDPSFPLNRTGIRYVVSAYFTH